MENSKYELNIIDGKLCLIPQDKKINPICVDFSSSEILNKITSNKKYQLPIIKALGLKPNKPITILDATAGLGKDAFLMSACGAKVIAIERNKIIYKLLQDGIKRAQQDEKIKNIANNIILHHGNSLDLIKSLAEKYNPDIIYLDPMFSKVKTSALPKKEFLILREIIKEEDLLDSDKLLEVAILHANKKVVVKRHKLSPYLANKKPNHIFTGKTNRFDIYTLL